MNRVLVLLALLFIAPFSSAQLIPAQTDSLQRVRQQDDSIIRASRAATNTLIASHDARGLGRYFYPDFIRISGNGNMVVGKDAAIAYWTKTFAEQPTIYYIRTPDQITISDDGLSAWESGTWAGYNTKSKGGRYAAQWNSRNNIWKLQSEFFITLSTY